MGSEWSELSGSDERSVPDTGDEKPVLARLQQIANPTTGIITGIKRIPVPPDEPAIEAFVAEREDFAPVTDGQAMAHEEGGGAFTTAAARIATYGEAIERYCGCVYRADAFRRAAYDELQESAIDPTAVVNFSQNQREAMDRRSDLCGPTDELSWVAGDALHTGETAFVPAQLVYLSYPPSEEPFIRNPISSGLAAGESREMAVRNGLCELVERDAFVSYYLTETELPVIDPASGPPRIRRLVDRVTPNGLELTLLDATTDLGVPVGIAVLVDRNTQPAVTVAAAAGVDAAGVIESALAEVAQTRLSAIHRLDNTAQTPDDIDAGEITGYADRGLFWAAHDRISDLDFWIESDRETSSSEFGMDTGENCDPVEQVTAAGYESYAVDVTTRDISNLGVSVQRVVAPRLQPLYLVEQLRYFGGNRLYETPVKMGYRDSEPSDGDLNTVPHPFP